MTTLFRLDAVTLKTTEGTDSYELHSDLTVLAGPTGVGKTTLLELIKFGFGAGEARLAPVALEYVTEVVLEVVIGRERLRIARSIDNAKRKTVRVWDLITQERLPDHNIGPELPSLNTLLMTALGFPDDMRAAASGNSSKEGSRITFGDIFSFLYIPQYEINRDIAGSQESYREPKRKAVFELLFGLTDPEILTMRSEINRLNGRIADADTEVKNVRAFLTNSSISEAIQAAEAFRTAAAEETQAAAYLAELREELAPAVDRQTQVLRDMLTEAEHGRAAAHATVQAMLRQQAATVQERRRVEADLARLTRMRDAGERLADIEFSVCPRCMQSLTRRETPPGSCRVCLQPDAVPATSDEDQYEARQLQAQLEEMDAQGTLLQRSLAAASEAVDDRQALVQRLTKEVDTRTAERITPRLQAFTDASERLARARAQQEALATVLRQWELVSELEATSQQLRTEQERLKAHVRSASQRLDERRNDVISSLSAEFQEAVSTLKIPGVQTASIHPTNYLPVLDGKVFHKFSPPGGGVVTATQLAYWTSLLAVALRHRDTSYPAFLLIDSPRLALNTATELSAALYKRIVMLADANPKFVQFVIADNELPRTYRGHFDEIDFDYVRPTVPSVHHPGLAHVTTIGEPTSTGT